MKKLFSLFAVVLLAFTLTGCKGTVGGFLADLEDDEVNFKMTSSVDGVTRSYDGNLVYWEDNGCYYYEKAEGTVYTRYTSTDSKEWTVTTESKSYVFVNPIAHLEKDDFEKEDGEYVVLVEGVVVISLVKEDKDYILTMNGTKQTYSDFGKVKLSLPKK